MTPAGLSAFGSVRWAAWASAMALWTPTVKANAATQPAIHTTLMGRTVAPTMSVDVSNSLLLSERQWRPPVEDREDGGREHSIWPVIGPTLFVLALLVLATAYAGAFNVDQWGPPTLFILLMLLTFVLRGGAARLPDRWVGLALAGAWGLAAWAAASSAWSGSPAAALEGAGRQVMYAAILTLPFVAVGDMRA